MKQYKIVHYKNDCIACNACVLAAPQTWRMNEEEGMAELKDGVDKKDLSVGTILEIDLEDNQKAAEACPMRIIKISDGK